MEPHCACVCAHMHDALQVRELKIPASEGYKDRGFPAWGIPGGAALKFEIEVLSIN